MNQPAGKLKGANQPSARETIVDFFLEYLNKIFCAKAHLAERLPELAEQAEFRDLKNGILETLDDITKQIARIEEIYVLLNAEPSIKNADDLIGFVENGFENILQQRLSPKMRDMSILFYMSIIESMEVASFKVLQIAALEIPDKQIKQLLRENFDESKADRELFMQITSKYVNQI
jgi:ferritin-like metal-binding protein YciE